MRRCAVVIVLCVKVHTVIDEEFQDSFPPKFDGSEQGFFLLQLRSGMNFSTGLDQLFKHVVIPDKGSMKQRRFACVITGFGVGDVAEQGGGVGGNKKGRPTEFVFSVEFGAFADQKFRELGLVFCWRHDVALCARMSLVHRSRLRCRLGFGWCRVFQKKGTHKKCVHYIYI